MKPKGMNPYTGESIFNETPRQTRYKFAKPFVFDSPKDEYKEKFHITQNEFVALISLQADIKIELIKKGIPENVAHELGADILELIMISNVIPKEFSERFLKFVDEWGDK